MPRRLCTAGDITTGIGPYLPQALFKKTPPLVDIEGIPVLTVADGVTPFVNPSVPESHPAQFVSGSALIDIEGSPVLLENDVVGPDGSKTVATKNFLVFEE